MRVVASNSGCCAIKYIRDFPYRPEDSTPIAVYDTGHDEDEESSTPEPYENWTDMSDFNSTYVNAGDAFRRLMAQIKERRPAGIININLAADPKQDEDTYDYIEGEFDRNQINAWEKVFDEYGFTKVVAMNSNTGAEIHHYTLVYDEGGWEA